MLEKFFQELNDLHFTGELPVPRLLWNSRLTSSAGRFSPGRSKAPLIEIATYLRELPDGEIHIKDTLLHEMVHYLLWHRRRPYGHTKEFNAILKKVGARRYNPVPKHVEYKHWYECPACRERLPTRRLIGVSACAKCCRKWNRGKYSEKYRLRKVSKEELVAASMPQKNERQPLPAASEFNVSEVIQKLELLKQFFTPKS